ncbi:hypothetical protein PF008_g24197 [Phytophthora fragariae]|uniref:RNase H type-1 domain-containing protein n=1 Tax=Phytophthora fragariae TaxID=53985 RepID=A0A6G0QNR6_9STRA|nr:hypothetical protein PF008_g24197 [Phytophthora fragariae]
MEAQGFILEDVTVNDAEYNGLLKGLQMARERNITELVVVGDSRIVIQQVQGLINCHQPNLQRKLAECEAMKEHFTSLRLVHVKRDFNQAADYITSKTLVLDDSWTVQEEDERRHLEQVSKIPEQLMKSQASPGVDIRVPESLADVSFQKENVDVGSESAPLPNAARVMAAVTRSGTHREAEDSSRPPLGPLEYQAERRHRHGHDPADGNPSATQRRHAGVLGRCVELMRTKSNWMRLFSPKMVRQAVWADLGRALAAPIDSTSTLAVARETEGLLRAMGCDSQMYPSTMAHADWSPTEAATALSKWKKKLRTAFGATNTNVATLMLGSTTYLVQTEADPSRVPLPPTPQKGTTEVKGGTFTDKGPASPYMQDSHMVTPRSVDRSDRLAKENEASFTTPNTRRTTVRPPETLLLFAGVH